MAMKCVVPDLVEYNLFLLVNVKIVTLYFIRSKYIHSFKSASICFKDICQRAQDRPDNPFEILEDLIFLDFFFLMIIIFLERFLISNSSSIYLSKYKPMEIKNQN